MAKCAFIKPDGKRCKLQASSSNGLCWSHDPANKQKRRAIAIKGGRSRAVKETQSLKQELIDIRAEARAGVLDYMHASILGQLIRAHLQVIVAESKFTEEAYEERLSTLEADYQRLVEEIGSQTWRGA